MHDTCKNWLPEQQTDKEFLVWIHERLEHVYHDRPILGFMRKLRNIIAAMPNDQISPAIMSNSLADLNL